MSVLLAAPCGETPRCDVFYDNFYNLNLPEGSFRERVRGGSLSANRNRIVEIAKERKLSHIFFVDDDTMFHPNMVLDLLAHSKDVVAGHCCQRLPPFRSYVFDSIQDGKLGFKNLTNETGLIKVLGVGVGGFLIRTGVFDYLPKPYFCNNYVGEVEWGDDILFNKKLIEAQIEVYCDLDQRIFHASKCAVYPEFKDGKWTKCVVVGSSVIRLSEKQ